MGTGKLIEAIVSFIWISVAVLLVAMKKGFKPPENVEKFAKNVKHSGMTKLSQLQHYAMSKGAVQPEEAESVFESDETIERIPGDKPVSTLSELFQEDRRNDWLARQMKEERKRTVWNNFSDLGAHHDAVCDAEILRRDHQVHHEENVVDDGVI